MGRRDATRDSFEKLYRRRRHYKLQVNWPLEGEVPGNLLFGLIIDAGSALALSDGIRIESHNKISAPQ